MSDPAVFLDRDGVLISLVWDATRGTAGAPLRSDLVRLQEGVSDGLGTLRELGYKLILASNQPDAATGRSTLDGLDSVHDRFAQLLKQEGVPLDGYWYCYHHPDGGGLLGVDCSCRKPKPGMILSASVYLDLDLERSWMIGDRDKDIEAGNAAAVRTILIEQRPVTGFPGLASPRLACPTAVEASFLDAVEVIRREGKGFE